MSQTVFSQSELSAIVRPLLEKHRIGKVYLFGSYARREARPESDIDLLLDGDRHMNPLAMYAFGEDVRDATDKRVDLFELSELDDGSFKDRVLSEAVAL